MAIELGKAFVQIIPSARGISGMITKEMTPGGKVAGISTGQKIATAIKGTLTAAAIGKFLGATLTQGGELQQSLGGVETMFKDHADTIKKYANDAYKTVGVSANDYMKNVTSFSAALIKANNGKLDVSVEDANMAMIDMADNANKMGTSIESIQNAYQGFAKQNYTMLDNLKLGYGGTKSEMVRLLKDASAISGMNYDIGNLSDVFNAINVIQGQLGITGTTAKEAAETLTGSLAAMKASFQNVLGGLSLGQDIKPHLKALAQTTATFVFGNLIPMIGNIATGLPSALITFVKESVPYLLQAGRDFMTFLSNGMGSGYFEIITRLSTSMQNILQSIGTYLPAFLERGVDMIRGMIQGIAQGLPHLLSAGANLIAGFLELFMQNYPLIMRAGVDIVISLLQGITDHLPAIGNGVIEIVSKFIDTFLENLPQYVKMGANLIISLVEGIITNAPKLVLVAGMLIVKFIAMIVSKLPEIVLAGAEILKNLVLGIGNTAVDLYHKMGEIMGKAMDQVRAWRDRFFEAGKNIVSAIADGIRSAIGVVTDSIGSVVQSVRNYLPFSPAKEGPLRDLNKLDFTIIADGIYNAKKPITDAMNSLAKSTIDSYDAVSNINSNVRYSQADVDGLRSYQGANSGDLVIQIENVYNENDRNIQDLAESLEFYRKRKGQVY